MRFWTSSSRDAAERPSTAAVVPSARVTPTEVQAAVRSQLGCSGSSGRGAPTRSLSCSMPEAVVEAERVPEAGAEGDPGSDRGADTVPGPDGEPAVDPAAAAAPATEPEADPGPEPGPDTGAVTEPEVPPVPAAEPDTAPAAPDAGPGGRFLHAVIRASVRCRYSGLGFPSLR